MVIDLIAYFIPSIFEFWFSIKRITILDLARNPQSISFMHTFSFPCSIQVKTLLLALFVQEGWGTFWLIQVFPWGNQNICSSGMPLPEVKGVFSKHSGNHIVAPNLCFLSKRPQILATCLFFNFAELCKVSARLDNIYIRHFPMVSPLVFFIFVIHQKFKGGTIVKCLI